LIKFDHADFPELQSAAEVISTKILYAAGYNVPENFVAFVDAKNLQIGDGVEISDQTKKKRPFTRGDLDEMLRRVAKTSDGRYRVLASKFLPGKPKGSFPQIGMRRDDPNDQIPHEYRRELRGLRVIASWINHWDMKEENGLDMYVEEGGRKFLRHYLIDFGSTLGGGNHPLEYFHGREYAFDFRNIMKELFTLGMYVTPSEKDGTLISPAVGLFSANDFDPAAWRSSYPVAPFEEMTDEDAFWATRIILSFTEAELQSIVGTARYSNSRDADYVLRTLLERRRTIARYWLSKTNPISDFSVAPAQEGIALTFSDLQKDCNCEEPRETKYVYQVASDGYKSEQKATQDPRIVVDRTTLGAIAKSGGSEIPFEIRIWTYRSTSDSNPVKVDVHWIPLRDAFTIRRISRR